MIQSIEKKLIIVNCETKLHRYDNDSCNTASLIYNNLKKTIGCTYLIYMYENLLINEKFVYSSNWDWQNLLIGKKLINHCPVFLTAFNCLEKTKKTHLFIPWYSSPPANKEERNVCGLRSEFNIANGFGYGAKDHTIRESLAFGGDVKDLTFYKNFIVNPNIFYDTLYKIRLSLLLKNHADKFIHYLTKNSQN